MKQGRVWCLGCIDGLECHAGRCKVAEDKEFAGQAPSALPHTQCLPAHSALSSAPLWSSLQGHSAAGRRPAPPAAPAAQCHRGSRSPAACVGRQVVTGQALRMGKKGVRESMGPEAPPFPPHTGEPYAAWD